MQNNQLNLFFSASPNIFYDIVNQDPKAHIFAVRGGQDIDGRYPRIHCLDNELTDEQMMKIKYNQFSAFEHADIKVFQNNNTKVVFQKLTHEIQEKAQNLGFAIANNSVEVQQSLENKTIFRQLIQGKDYCLPTIHISKAELANSDYSQFPEKCVIQGDQTSGGRGTYFIFSESDFKKFQRENITQNEHKEYIVTEYMQGQSKACIGINISDQTVVTTSYQQIMEDERLLISGDINLKGKFLGNSISDETFSNQEKIRRIIQEIGKTLREVYNYKGVFGIDFLETETGNIYVLECNPRITGAFPVIDGYYSQKNIPTPSMLHIAAFSDSHEYDLSSLQDRYIRVQNTISQALILINKDQFKGKNFPHQKVKAGKYRIVEGEIKYKGISISLHNLAENEFLLTEVPKEGTKMGKRERIARIIMNWEYQHTNTNQVLEFLQKNLLLPTL